jgi:NAD-dependent SIR2 family protein deacetylase
MDLATPEAFARDPALVTQWYEWRLCRCAACAPNPGHVALARLESALTRAGRSFTLLTQNVDGLHQEAGSRNVHELHGSIRTWRCLRCAAEHPMPDPPFPEHPLRCAHCRDGILRPGVVWFGEMLPERALQAAAEAIDSCDLFMSVGTSAVVYPAAAFAHEARAHAATVIEINRDPTPLTDLAGLSLLGKSGEILPSLVDEAFPEG